MVQHFEIVYLFGLQTILIKILFYKQFQLNKVIKSSSSAKTFETV